MDSEQQQYVAWNAKRLDNEPDPYHVYSVLGANHIHYLFYVPVISDTGEYWNDAVHVQSIKGHNKYPSRSKESPGKIYKPGQFQPVGDRRYFTYYQRTKMTERGDWDDFLEKAIESKQANWVAKIEEIILQVFSDEEGGE
jgi:hypothetical protein